jgi:HlyD family secretion protein
MKNDRRESLVIEPPLPPPRRMKAGGVRAVAALAALVVSIPLGGCARRQTRAGSISTEPVERRDITVTVEATGTVEPINLVEVKSKASGQIIRMPVEVGSVVRPGQLLAQIDSSDVRNQYDQAAAALDAAQAKSEVSLAQKKRADALFAQQIITAEEHESASLDYANARSQLVKARTDLDIARQRLADATVRAPVAGTVLAKPVSVGQVISSATSSVSGGTTLLQMADLHQIRVRVLVSESDIGNVAADQPATVQVDAYPQRTFQGRVEKIEPQSVVQQSVTMFPVLVSISNEDGLLLPGMNGEVVMLVRQRPNVVAVPLDAVRTLREIPAVATALGLDPDSLRAAIETAVRARAGADTSRTRGADSARAGAADRPWRSRGGDSGRGGRSGFGGGRAGSGGRGGFAMGASSGAGGAGGFGRSGRGNGLQVAFVRTAKGLDARLVRLGLSNYDYAEVLDGLREGDEVVLLSVSELQAQRSENLSRLRQRMGSTMPGVGGGAGAGGGRSGGARRTGG